MTYTADHAKALAILSAAWPRFAPPEDTTELYLRELGERCPDTGALYAAVREIVENSDRFPAISQILAVYRGHVRRSESWGWRDRRDELADTGAPALEPGGEPALPAGRADPSQPSPVAESLAGARQAIADARRRAREEGRP